METKHAEFRNQNKEPVKSKRIDVVTCFIVNKEGKVLIETRSDECALDKGEKDLCSGHMELNESPKDAMLRELKEELGIENVSDKLKRIGTICIDIGKKRHYSVKVFYLKLDEEEIKKIVKQDIEVEKVEWIKMKDCFEQMRNGEIRVPKSNDYEVIFNKVEETYTKEESLNGFNMEYR